MRPHSYHSLHSRIYHYCKQAASSFASEYGWYAIGYSVGIWLGAFFANTYPGYPAWQIGLAGFIGTLIPTLIWWGARAIYNHHRSHRAADDNQAATRQGRPDSQPHTSNQDNGTDDHNERDFKLIYGTRGERIYDHERDR